MSNFSPYFFSEKLNGTDHKSGINWSYVSFATREDAETFAEVCHSSQYRTRNLHQTDNGKWAVQYHHYAD